MISFSNPSFGDHCDLFAYSHFLMDPLGERFRAWEPASIYLHHLISHVQYKRYVYCIILRYIIYNYILGIRCVYIYIIRYIIIYIYKVDARIPRNQRWELRSMYMQGLVNDAK